MLRLRKNQSAFTIVELLVVIVVIGILAAIAIVSYTGITNRATIASLQSDLANASQQLKMFQVDNSNFPTTISTNCTTNPTTTTNLCLKASSGNTFAYFPISGSNPQQFTLINTNTVSATRYSVTDNSAPVSGSANWIAGIASTALANKWVYNADLTGTYQYKTTQTAVLAPQGAIGLDPNYPSNMVLISPQANPTVDFSEYPAQNVCRAIGGRLPNISELLAIYAGRITTYGNNFQVSHYWASMEWSGSYAYLVYFGDGVAYGAYNNYTNYVRCVSG